MSLPVLAAVVAAIAIPTVVLIAWAMWLFFAATIAKRHGIDALKVINQVADGFRPRDWTLLIPTQLFSRVLNAECTRRCNVDTPEPSDEHLGETGDAP